MEIIDLVNEGSSGLGFMLVGGRSTGVVIKAVIPGGIAERDGRLQTGDHVLQIGEVNLRGFSSDQVAMVLRQSGGNQVRLIVARPVEPSSVDFQSLASSAPIIPTKLLSDPEEMERVLMQTGGFTQQHTTTTTTTTTTLILTPPGEEAPPPPLPVPILERPSSQLRDVGPTSDTLIISTTQTLTTSEMEIINNNINRGGDISLIIPQSKSFDSSSPESPETEVYEVELRKNVYGLGITVAGYVCEEEDLSGIFVKSIIEGSAAEQSGKIQINDRIVEVDGQSLNGVTNHQAVDILRNTEIAVNLKLERFLRGRKYEHLQTALTENGRNDGQSGQQANAVIAASKSMESIAEERRPEGQSDDEQQNEEGGRQQGNGLLCIEGELESHTTIDSNVFVNENGSHFYNHDDEECDHQGNESSSSSSSSSDDRTPMQSPAGSVDSLVTSWRNELPGSKIVVVELNKLSGLGISLEGTVEVENGIEMRPHHFIRSILDEGPIGRDGRLKTGDELLQANEFRLQGLKHIEVVKIMKDLPKQVKLICSRGNKPPSVINTSQSPEAFEARSILGLKNLQTMLTKAQSESSLYTSSTATLTDQRSKSFEQMSGLALWTTDIVYIDMEKTDTGFGFSILDYQDPLDPDGTVIVVRGLIPGGAAETTNLVFPGDRLVSVNGINLHGMNLDQAVNVLKGMPVGMCAIGLCRPLSNSDSNIESPESADTPTT